MPEPRWRDVDMKTGVCSHCGGTHHGTGMECPFREENMGEPCAVCGARTNYCCSDCAIDGAGKVYVCVTDACRTEHEKKHRKAAAPDPFNGELFHAKNLLKDIERNSGAFDHFMDLDRRVLATALRLAIANAPTN